MKKNISFEDAIHSLEDIVKKLENGDVSLEDSLDAFEEAVALVKMCNKKLDTAESKVRILLEGEDGCINDAPFDADDEA